MDLSNDLISKFVKITNDGDKKKTKEGTVYGTAVKYDGNMYVKIDGSDLLTPIDTTADIKEGERVTIMIKDHNATVTGNVTSPSASSADVKKVTRNVEEIEGEITEFEAIIADVVHVGELDAEVARIDELIAGKATIEDLTATNAEITNLKAKDAEIENLVADKATIEDLTATNAEITNLKAKDAEIENLVADKATIEDLTATNAEITNLKANKADITYLDANFATIDELEATHANIDVLDAEVANINTLVNGNLTSDNILSFNITSKNTTMEDAFIKDAMIDRITANKIMSGTIDTNNVTIQSTDGSMLLQGTLLQMKDDNGKVRIQIGKDTGGNFTFVLYDESGTGVLIDEEGIKSSDAIADGLIVDAKVADNANIAGSKLDIASVITEVNNDNSTTIKSNKIYLDEQGQSLEVAFNSLKTQVETIQDVSIDGDLAGVIEQVQSNTTKIEVNKEGISALVAENTSRKEEIQNLDGEIESVNNTLSSKYSSLEQDVSGFKTTVADTYATKQSVTDVSNNLATNYSTTSAMNSAIQQKANEITSSVSQTYATKQSVTDVNNNLANNYSTTSAMNSAIQQKANEITSTVSQTYISNYEAKKLADTTTTGLNKYLFERYQRDGFDYSTRPTLNDLVGARLIESQLVDNPPPPTSDLGSNYIGVLTFYLYYDHACTKTITITTDDNGTVYLNNVGIYDLTTCRPANVTFNMIKGLNRIDIIYAEDGGGDGVSWGGVDGWSAFGAYANVVTNEIANRTNELTLAMTQGNMLYTDPTFRNGENYTFVYNNLGNNTVIKERITAIEGCPNTSGYCLKITTNGKAAPWLGGFAFGNKCRYNAVFITKITAKIPIGYSITWGSNAVGDNGEQKWLSSTAGTGDWYDYYCKLKCGDHGSISRTNYFYLVGPQASAENPVTWYVSYATVFDVTDSDERITNLTNNLAVNYSTTSAMNSAIQQKANEITSSVSETYATKQSVTDVNNNLANNYSTTSAMNSAIQQKANEITSTVSQTYTTKSEFNNLQIGGKNLLLNSKREASTNIYWITEFRPTELFEVGEIYTVSICVTPANGVTHIQPCVSGGWSYLSNPLYVNGATKQVLSITFTFYGYASDRVPVDIYDSKAFVQFYRLPNDGTVTSNTTIHWAKVEKGAKATDWTPAPEDVQGQIDTINTNLTTYATKSELTQTNNSIVAKFSESGGYNLIRNSTGAGGNTNGWTHSGTSMGVSSNDGIGSANRYYLYLDNGTTTTERFAYSSRFKLKPNTTYRFTGYFHNYTKYPSFNVFVLSSTSLPDTDTTTGYTNAHHLIQGASTNNIWKKFTTTFTTPASTKSGILRIDNNGYNQSGTDLNRVHWNCLILTEGEMEVPWSPHPSEIYDGITKIDKNGLQVSQSNYNGYTQMKADGFYVNNGSENVISITKDGSYFKGKVVITSGSTVPTSVLSGTISSSQLNSTITSDISTAKSNASTAVSTANTASTNASNAVKTANTASTNASNAVKTANTASTNASTAVSTANTASTNASNAVKTANTASTNASTAVSTANTAKSTAETANSTANSVKSTVDSGKTNWNNAYNRVNEWAYGAVTGSTTIDGGLIQANTILANKLALMDFTNYAQLNEKSAASWGFSYSNETAGTLYTMSSLARNKYISEVHLCNGGETLRIKGTIATTCKGYVNSSATSATYLGTAIGIYCYNGAGTAVSIEYSTRVAATSSGTETSIDSTVTIPSNARRFRVFVQTDGVSNFSGTIKLRNIQVLKCQSGELIVDGVITTAKIAAGAITAAKIASRTITADRIVSGAITANEIAAGTITAAKIASRTITADRIVSGAITANEIAANAITAGKIAAGAITADKLAANAITSKTITGSTITGGTISGATITSETLMKTYGGMYVGSEIWGGFKKDSNGNYSSAQTFTIRGSTALQIDGYPTRISSVTGEVKIGDASSYDNLRAREIYAQEIIYTNDLRTRNAAQLSLSNVSMRSENAFIDFSSGYGVIRVTDRNHLYLQTKGNTGGDLSAEIRCTRYSDRSNYVNIRAYNVCAQNAVYANGVNVSSDINRKRDIELYSTDALHEVCSTPVYAYHLDTDKDEELKRIGIIMQEAPLDAIDLTGKGVDLYQMVTMLWRAVQQQQEIINELKGE